MQKLGIVADDLTGATTTGVLLARSKSRTAVFFNGQAAKEAEGLDELQSVIISTSSRALSSESAYNEVAAATEALKNMGTKHFSKRIDTTLRGGVGVEIDAMMDTIGNDVIAIVVPSMPQSRRIVVGGYSIIDSVSLIRTPVAQDVRTPVTENYVPKLLSKQSRRKVGLVKLGTVLKGPKAIAQKLLSKRESGCEIIVVDAVSIEDVEAIARACVQLFWNVLAVDPGAFTAKLAYCRGLVQTEAPDVPTETLDGQGKTILITAGSATPVTKHQMEVLCEDPRHVRISIDPLQLIEGGVAGEAETNRAIAQAISLLEQDQPPRAILLETALHGILLDLDKEDSDRGYGMGQSAEMINAYLGKIVKGILDAKREQIAGLYCTGGDTEVNVCRALGVQWLEVVDYVIAQTDIGRLTGEYAGIPIIGKGGLTGNDTIVLDIVDRLFKEATRK
ncbi:MAG: four-carbon acid sugar kinase family protein [Clostridiales bacterium]|nr:four-carbon acid sugar kinase family protein [Clostridiales bacterium]